MKKILIFFFCFAGYVQASFSQSIERKLIGTAGSTWTAGGNQLSFSIGEVIITPSPSATLSPGANAMLVTIGFQQPHIAKTGTLLPDIRVSAYPNPAIDIVRLDIHGDNFQPNQVRITNAIGQLVIAPFIFINGSIEIRLQQLAAGSYFVTVTGKGSGNTVTTQIIKQNN